ncbi:MAG TPA: Zn-ribbon domain-containing OB-fold protein [Deltaproteobacteria bacterium]|nr:Zn-ribbon domain-containing OB-fold protein [Deltaproteobacteria bacterium]
MTTPTRPRPKPTPLTEPFWRAAAEGRLVAQRCRGCNTLRHYPRPMCPECHDMRWDWSELSGRGEIHSYVVTHRAFHPFWADRIPYVVATIELEEGLRMVSEMPELTPDEVAIGLPVEVRFEPLDDGIALPVFRLSKSRRG